MLRIAVDDASGKFTKSAQLLRDKLTERAKLVPEKVGAKDFTITYRILPDGMIQYEIPRDDWLLNDPRLVQAINFLGMYAGEFMPLKADAQPSIAA